MSITFDRPLLLLLLPVCIGFVYALWRTSRVYMPPLRRRLSLGLRLAIVAVLLAVLAEPRVQLQANDLAVAFLLDRSDSVTPSMQADEGRWLAAALNGKTRKNKGGVVAIRLSPANARTL